MNLGLNTQLNGISTHASAKLGRRFRAATAHACEKYATVLPAPTQHKPHQHLLQVNGKTVCTPLERLPIGFTRRNGSIPNGTKPALGAAALIASTWHGMAPSTLFAANTAISRSLSMFKPIAII
jgi:hypothetical protein